jgi:tight adherence protein C
MNIQNMLPLLVAALASASVMLAFFGLRGLLNGRQRAKQLQRRVRHHISPTRISGMQSAADTQQGRQQLTAKLNDLMSTIGERLAPRNEEQMGQTNLALVRAGYRSRKAPLILWGAKAGCMLLGLTCGLLIRLAAGETIPAGMLALLFICPAVLGLYLPDAWVSSKVRTRRRQMEDSLPDALDLLVVCVEAGMGLDQAIGLGEELSMLVSELRAGKTRSESLKNLAHRVGLEDVNSLVTLIIQADAFGTSIAHTLRVYSDTMRTTRFQRAEEIAAKMPVKLLFPLVFCILPALFVAIMGPAGIRLMQVFSQME